MSLFDLEEKYNKNCMNYCSYAQGLYNDKKYQLALESYAKSLHYLCSLCNIQDVIEKSDIGSSSSYIKTRISNTLFLALLLKQVTDCYFLLRDYDKAVFFLEKFHSTLNALEDYSPLKYPVHQEFAQQYENVASTFPTIEQMVKLGKAVNDSKAESIPKINELEDSFQQLCSNLDEACSYKSCLLYSESIQKGTNTSSSSSCFIATAAYSTSTHPDLDTFRSFRDEKLLPYPLGKNLVRLYYKTGPTLAKYIEKQPAIKQKLKHHLANLATWMRHKKITSR